MSELCLERNSRGLGAFCPTGRAGELQTGGWGGGGGAGRGEEGLTAAGINPRTRRRMLCLCVGVERGGGTRVEGRGGRGGRESGAREGRGCPLPAELP